MCCGIAEFGTQRRPGTLDLAAQVLLRFSVESFMANWPSRGPRPSVVEAAWKKPALGTAGFCHIWAQANSHLPVVSMRPANAMI